MRIRWTGLAVIVLMLGFAMAVYPRLPAEVPTHWNAAGEIDGWSPRFPFAFVPALVALGIWLLAGFLPRIDPRRERYESFVDTYWLLINVILVFLAGIQILVLGAALEWPVDVATAIQLGMGAFFIVLGNYIPRVRSNWWMGIRTPWTLSSERVWRKTHRLAGWSFVVGGVLLLAVALLPQAVRGWVTMGVILAAGLVPTVYSYIVWRREPEASEGSVA